METIVIDRRFRGPPNSGNGGYVCGLIAKHIQGGAEVTLLAPPPLDCPLELVENTDSAIELREKDRVLGIGRNVSVGVTNVPIVTLPEAEEAASRTPYDESTHKLPTCFVCGPSRVYPDSLHILAGPSSHRNGASVVFAAPWTPSPDLSANDGRVASEFVWASLDCPTGYAVGGARHLGLDGGEPILLGRLSARIDTRPHPGETCVVVAWPTSRDNRKLFADGALLSERGEVLAVARATWLLVDRQVQIGAMFKP